MRIGLGARRPTLSMNFGGLSGVTRPSYGAGEQIGHDLMRAVAIEAGLEVTTDAAGNLYATLPGSIAVRRAGCRAHISIRCRAAAILTALPVQLPHWFQFWR
jgi:hypothetical protein